MRHQVFISYSHKDKEWLEKLQTVMKPLVRKGLVTLWADTRIQPGQKWREEIAEAIARAKVAVLLVSPEFLASDFIAEHELPPLLKAAERDGLTIVWVPIRASLFTETAIADYQAAYDPGKPLAGLSAAEADKALVQISQHISAAMNKENAAESSSAASGHDFQIAPSPLLRGAQNFLGREDDLKRVDQAWEDPGTHILVMAAWGGVGKTSLVVEWMARKAAANWPGFERVFEWSFYNQGTSARSGASADLFIAAALGFFGDHALARSAASAWDKGARLAQLIAQRNTLLVLDGLEPLQHPPGPLAGRLRDPAMAALLRGLATQPNPNASLCIITTREGITDLDEWMGKTVAYLGEIERTGDKYPKLAKLTTTAGVDLLKTFGVRGSDAEIQKLVEEVRGHALTLNLLGRYLAAAHGGDIGKRSLVNFEKADENIQGGHAFKTMAAYETWLVPKVSLFQRLLHLFSAEKRSTRPDGRRQLAVLRLLGLFDRPADLGCLAELRREPAIPGLTEPLVGLSDDDWNLTLSSLAECELISKQKPESLQPSVDAHPLIREYFAKQLAKHFPTQRVLCHKRIFWHIRIHTKKHPACLEEMMELLPAVTHGCSSQQYERALALFRRRVRYKEKNVSVWKFGLYQPDLNALRCFFTKPNEPSPQLCAPSRAYIFNEVGADLRALGNFSDAAKMINQGVLIQEGFCKTTNTGKQQLNAHTRLANYFGNQASLHLAIGTLKEAKVAVTSGMKAADISQDIFQMVNTRTTLGHIFHKMGDIAGAREIFEEAKIFSLRRQKKLQGLQGSRYCAFLLECGDYLGVLNHVDKTFGPAQDRGWQREVALFHLNRGCALTHLEGPNSEAAGADFDMAVKLLEHTGHRQYFPEALISRSNFYRRRAIKGDGTAVGRAMDDLERAFGIIGATRHLLAECDALCVEARLSMDQGDVSGCRKSVIRLSKLVFDTGYELRNYDLALFKAWIAISEHQPRDGRTILEDLRTKTQALGIQSYQEDIDQVGRLLPEETAASG